MITITNAVKNHEFNDIWEIIKILKKCGQVFINVGNRERRQIINIS